MSSSGKRNKIGTEQMMEDVQEHQSKQYNHVESMSPKCLPRQAQASFDRPAGRRAVYVQEEDGHNTPFSFEMGLDSITESAEE